MDERINSLYNFKFWHLWLIVVMFYLILSILSNIFIFTDNFYYNSLLDKFEIKRILEQISLQRKLQIFGYLFIPIALLLKVSLTASIIFIGIYLISHSITYKDCLKITLLAELPSIIGILVGTALLIIKQPANVEAIQYFNPLSMTQLLNMEKIPEYLFYP